MVLRCMAFADLANFTQYTHVNGTHASARLLSHFRANIRAITGRHGVRVAKWLGDGVMLVGTSTEPVLSTLADLIIGAAEHDYAIHCGAAYGQVIIFEGDDYLGRTVNIAARLCDQARPGCILTHQIPFDDIPDSVTPLGIITLNVKGIGQLSNINCLHTAQQFSHHTKN